MISKRTILLSWFSLILCGTLAFGQRTSATVSGTVKDPGGAVVQGATVIIKNVDTGLQRRLSTDASGFYRADGVPLGQYEVRAEHEGFNAEVRSGLTLTVAQDAVVDFNLTVGSIQAEVVITGEAPLIQRNSAALGELVDARRVHDLPLNGRDITQLTLLQPGVLRSRGSTRDINVGFGTKVTVAGARPNQNLFILDGTDANDALNNTPAGAPGQVSGVETIKEFRVSTNTMSAEFGRLAGGVFNIVTKSGTNEVHGSGFWYHRNDNLDARNFFDAQKPEFRRNQFGFTLGGPVVKDRTFAFGSYEGLREDKGETQVAFVPGRAIRNAQPGTSITFPATGRSVTVDPDAARILNLYPLPTGPEVVPGTLVEEFRGILNRFANEDFLTARVDHRFSDSDTLFGRYLFTDSEFLLPVLFPAYPNLDVNRRQIFTLGYTHIFTPRVLNEMHFGFNRSTPAELVPDPPTEVQLLRGRVLGSINVTADDGLPGLTEIGTDRTNPKLFFNNTYQVSDNLFINRGRHAMKAGFLIERFQFNGNSESRTRGRLEFRSLLRLLRDEPRRIEGASATSDFVRGYRQSLFGFYFQDDMRITPRFSLFAGVRYEFITTPKEVNDKVSNATDIFNPAARIIVADQRFANPNANPPILCCRQLFDNPTLRNIAPRLGLAWDVTGKGKTVLRTGFGIFYEQPLFHLFRSPIFRALPFVERSRINAGDWPGGASIASLPLDPRIFASPGAGQETENIQFDLKPSYVLQYNLNLQQDLGWRTVVTLAYVGSRGVNLFGQGDTNIAIPEILPDGRQFFRSNRRRNPSFDVMRSIFQGFNSWYNALQLGLVKQQTHGLTVQGAYTFSRCLDERSGAAGRQEQRFGQARTFDPFNRALDKSLCDFHVKHNFVVNHIYDIPLGKGLSGAAGKLASGWQLSGILNLASGIPFTPFIEGDPDNDGSDDNTARPNLIGDPTRGSCPNGAPVGTPRCWFNPAAFAFPGTGFRGNAARNTVIGPDLASYDFSIIKTTPITERARVELRFEFFNLFNRTNFNPPSNSDDGARLFSASGTMDPTGAIISERSGTSTTSREIQVALRIIF
jgi:hypothetical protein